MQYSSAKGVFDILPLETDEKEKWRESARWHYVEQVLRSTAQEYGFLEMRTPIFETTDLFIRGVGESSDIVSKEMYTFSDRAERSLTLRPEGTAPFVRAFVQNQLYTQSPPYKYHYLGPMFRYDRPQAGRYRQFHQFGVEAIGLEKPEHDVEILDMLFQMLQRLGLKNVAIQINSVGDEESRTAYKKALENFLAPHFQQLSADSQTRFSKNILRILDSKSPQDQEILTNAPQLSDFLTHAAKSHFEKVLSLLERLKLPYTIHPKLVRGLDYYNHTVFEMTASSLGAQNAIGGGGRYDGLIASMGGPKMAGIGFAVGLERLIQTMLKQEAFFPMRPHPVLYLIPMGEKAQRFAFETICKLRHSRIPCDLDLSGKKIQHGLQIASEIGAEHVIIIGDQELVSGRAKIKNMQTRSEIEISLSEIATTFSPRNSHV